MCLVCALPTSGSARGVALDGANVVLSRKCIVLSRKRFAAASWAVQLNGKSLTQRHLCHRWGVCTLLRDRCPARTSKGGLHFVSAAPHSRLCCQAIVRAASGIRESPRRRSESVISQKGRCFNQSRNPALRARRYRPTATCCENAGGPAACVRDPADKGDGPK